MTTLRAWALLVPLAVPSYVRAQIPTPGDAPKPLSVADSAKAARLPPGYRLEILASEPVVREPSGMCWDERGRFYVCELHGYNLEGQYDIGELNKTGKLDTEVRRFFADPGHVAAAKREQYGTIKLLADGTGTGRYDKATVFADRLPACYGMVPYKGGLIAACPPDILYLADRDGDGVAEVREVLFSGFGDELMERRINDPHWGPDGWVYFGRGGPTRAITGPKLRSPVSLPSTDFRIRPDGSAIEPVAGGTKTVGFAWAEWGDRFVISTNTPALLVPPLDWRYLARNPYVAASLPEVNLSSDQRVYPASAPHPWRTKRAEDPGFSKFYRNRYGVGEASANGYFTSGCSPLVYQDSAIPALKGNLLTCEPAQNMLHRGTLVRTGVVPTYARPAGEERAEFLASTDVWFHPIALAHAPDGTVAIADFYREIIEDYSAIPRYLQQQYGLTNGKDHGRVWRLTHADVAAAPPADMSRLTADQLAREVASGHYWRRETARRLLLERNETAAVPALVAMLPGAVDLSAVLNVAHTLDCLGGLTPAQIGGMLAHAHPAVRIHGLRFSERHLTGDPALREKVFALIDDRDASVRLQLALTLGECGDARVLPLLCRLARDHNRERWMSNAILSSSAGRSGALLAELAGKPAAVGAADTLIEPLCAGIAARRDPEEFSAALVDIAGSGHAGLQRGCLRGFRAAMKTRAPVRMEASASAALKALAASADAQVRGDAEFLMVALGQEEPTHRKARLDDAIGKLDDLRAPVEARLAAVAQLAFEDDPTLTAVLFAAIPTSTPYVREAILTAVFSRGERFGDILGAVESKRLDPSAFTALQRASLLESQDPAVRERAAKLLTKTSGVSDETFRRYSAALAGQRDPVRGAALFKEKCATCHQAHDVGVAVGPNLSSEFQRAESTVVRDILAPNDVISPGYDTYSVETHDGRTFSGILVAESASSITLRGAGNQEAEVLRNAIDRLRVVTVSLMPENLSQTLAPRDVADVIAWLREPPTTVVLIDDDPQIVGAFKDARGKITLDKTERFAGSASLHVTGEGVSAARIKGWAYRIREHPESGEFRYLRFAYKVAGSGAMIETAAGGAWPPPDRAVRRWFSGTNTSRFVATALAADAPKEWTAVTLDLWKDAGDHTLTGVSLMPLGGSGWFDRFELLRSNGGDTPAPKK